MPRDLLRARHSRAEGRLQPPLLRLGRHGALGFLRASRSQRPPLVRRPRRLKFAELEKRDRRCASLPRSLLRQEPKVPAAEPLLGVPSRPAPALPGHSAPWPMESGGAGGGGGSKLQSWRPERRAEECRPRLHPLAWETGAHTAQGHGEKGELPSPPQARSACRTRAQGGGVLGSPPRYPP